MTNTPVKIHRSAERHWVGNGFPVASVFGYSDLGQILSPFLLLDYAAPYDFPPSKEKRGVGAHPHRGFETVTIAYQGEIDHRDSHGGGGRIGPGDVQWMTAASGLLHEEFHSPEFSERGGMFQMVQLWVNLPAKFKGESPRYQTLLTTSIPIVQLPDNGGQVRIIAGEFGGLSGPAKTYTPISLWDVTLQPGNNLSLDVPTSFTRIALVLEGEASSDTLSAVAGDLIMYERNSPVPKLRTTSGAKVLVMAGEPIDEPIVGYGPFVMNSQEEIAAAFRDYKEGSMGTL